MDLVSSGENRPLHVRRRPRRRLAFVLLSCAALALGPTVVWVSAVGNTVYVDDNPAAGCAAGNGQQGTPYCTIQAAICVAQSGDTVSVAPGTYLECIRMKPGVSVISQNGAAQTTINASGQPCNNSDFCTKAAGNACSAVIFSTGHTPATAITGFTIRGGAGLTQTQTVGGGGIFVFSSPTISNNVITQNVLSGPRRKFYGGGIYISLGAPIITGNTITGNRAVPAAGISGAPTYGYGGGIYSSFFASPTITNNVISTNVAGDPNLAFSLGGGGGIAVFPGDANTPGALIDRNTIADNTSDTMGGGVNLSSITNTMANAIVSNNVIVGNSSLFGGGLYTYYNRSTSVNNTIVDNLAQFGGGVYTGQSDVTRPVIISNNVITGNRLKIGGDGGGLYTFDYSATFDPTLENNDFFNNQKNNVSGDRNDANTIGVTGNFLADPNYINLAGRDFHLNNNSPAIDKALASRAPTVDRDNLPRGIDGNGFPNSPQPGDNDVGAYEWRPPCSPVTEVCNGIDDNCDTQIDEGFPNTDGDAMANCVDPDDDNDGALDGADCLPLDNSAFASPGEVTGVAAAQVPPTQITYTVQPVGVGTRYQIVSGLMSRLTLTGGFTEDFCVAANSSSGAWNDNRPSPPSGDAWYYMIRSVNNCGTGTFGSALMTAPRPADVCVTNIVDTDADGSPSDLDCNDADPNIAPYKLEVCDGLDNNCVGGVDEGNPGGGFACGTEVGECVAGVTMCSGTQGVTCVGGVGPGPELCDGKDNDCNGVIDDNVVDSDFDGLNDCVDTDDDNDLVQDTSDCAPLNNTAWGFPTEVTNLQAADTVPTGLSWSSQNIGTATQYAMATGTVTALGAFSFPAGTCLPTVTGTSTTDTRPAPASNQMYYYLVKSQNICGPGTWGTPARDTHPSCP